jgi:predicted nicotinamide N-methyase
MTQKDIKSFVKANFMPGPAKAAPEILLYQHHPRSGLTAFLGADIVPPYWAYGWAGGNVLARYILDHPEKIAGRHVLDIGAGSGIVAIAAAKAGAASVTAIDIDIHAIAATQLNAEANAVRIEVHHGDGLTGPIPKADLITMGDLFYDEVLARRALSFAKTCHTAGIEVWIGDPGRKPLPAAQLRILAEVSVPDFGQSALSSAAVYVLNQP